ncbi:hypothetical protein [Crateriforma spongiae]|uniref:hypothetical protein n=1 Tax=Crateriforma spongiae TaxID=2724528 RepID=UPI0039AF189A
MSAGRTDYTAGAIFHRRLAKLRIAEYGETCCDRQVDFTSVLIRTINRHDPQNRSIRLRCPHRRHVAAAMSAELSVSTPGGGLRVS